MNAHIGQLNRGKYLSAHEDTMYVQFLFDDQNINPIKEHVFAYPPCWGILAPGMTMEKHQHAMPEFYVFVQGNGEMTLGDETFNVKAGMSVNILPDVLHEVANAANAEEELIWLSIGLA